MKNLRLITTAVLFIFLLFNIAMSEELNKTFKGIRSIDIETTSGDCIIKEATSDEVSVHMLSDVFPEDGFKPELRQSGDKLYIDENWRGSASGKVVWTLTVPKGLSIEFSTASGDLNFNLSQARLEAKTASGDITIENTAGEIEVKAASGDVSLQNINGKEIEVKTASGEVSLKSVSGDLQVSTASGDVEGSDVKGDMEMSTASGGIDLKDVKGTLEFSCASGDIRLSGVVLEQASSFSTASGDVKVSLAQSAAYDVEMSAASGDVTLEYNGNPVKGYFEFSARKRGGNISAPFDFDKVEEYEQHGQLYERKSFTREKDNPRVYLSTSSGRATLKK